MAAKMRGSQPKRTSVPERGYVISLDFKGKQPSSETIQLYARVQTSTRVVGVRVGAHEKTDTLRKWGCSLLEAYLDGRPDGKGREILVMRDEKSDDITDVTFPAPKRR